jgi:hypothetical protein
MKINPIQTAALLIFNNWLDGEAQPVLRRAGTPGGGDDIPATLSMFRRLPGKPDIPIKKPLGVIRTACLF